jgi:hypothetical protein
MEEHMTIIDAHSHLWLRQDTTVGGRRILTLKNGRSIFMDEEVQMLPPFMIDGVNSAEVFLSNMDYAQVGASVVVQEVIDGNQNDYLKEVQRKYPDRFFCMGMAWNADEAKAVRASGLRGIAVPGHRYDKPLHTLLPMLQYMEQEDMILSMCLADDERQIGEMRELIQECPRLRVAIGHFGMPTTRSFEQQVRLALAGDRVMVESGGITWLYNSEFYPYPSAIRSIQQAASWVGWDRLMWGSDYPRTITAITYRMSYDFVSKSAELTEQQKALFLGLNAHRFYGFGPLPELPYIKNMSE